MSKSKPEKDALIVEETVALEKEALPEAPAEEAPVHPSDARRAEPVVGNPPKSVVTNRRGNIIESY